MTSVSPNKAQQLLKAIEQDQKLAEQLKAILREEKISLELRQYASYQALLQKKAQHLMDLELADANRRQALEEMGFNSDKNGFESFLEFVPDSLKTRFINAWQGLADQMNACNRINKINGKILAHAQMSLDRLMHMVKGPQTQVSVYQSNGKRSHNNPNRMLATA